MTWPIAIILVLLAIGVGVALLCSLGVLVISDVFNRLHYVGPATILGLPAIAAAVVVAEGFSASGIKAMLIAVVVLATSPVLTQVTARAARARLLRVEGTWPGAEDE
jgi:multicomponent Na+:H+ antiporter subunit G